MGAIAHLKNLIDLGIQKTHRRSKNNFKTNCQPIMFFIHSYLKGKLSREKDN